MYYIRMCTYACIIYIYPFYLFFVLVVSKLLYILMHGWCFIIQQSAAGSFTQPFCKSLITLIFSWETLLLRTRYYCYKHIVTLLTNCYKLVGIDYKKPYPTISSVTRLMPLICGLMMRYVYTLYICDCVYVHTLCMCVCMCIYMHYTAYMCMNVCVRVCVCMRACMGACVVGI